MLKFLALCFVVGICSVLLLVWLLLLLAAELQELPPTGIENISPELKKLWEIEARG